MTCEILLELEQSHACIRAMNEHITSLTEDNRKLVAMLADERGE